MNNRREIVFIDTSLNDWETLVTGFSRDIEVVLLDHQQNGLKQIAAHLLAQTQVIVITPISFDQNNPSADLASAAESTQLYDAIHILSHGSAGQLYLGSTLVNTGNLKDHQNQLQQIGAVLNETGDLLLYGCDVAQGESGAQFITALAEMTEADVAASNDLTGSIRLGGNWNLENQIGKVESTTIALNSGYQQVLAINTITGSKYSETLNGTSGDDHIDGGGGHDDIDGGGGTDTVVFFGNRADFQVTALNGVTRVYGLSTATSRYNGYETFIANAESVQFADTTLTVGPTTNNVITGDSYSRTFNGTNGNDTIDGRGGHDDIDGGGGTDTVVFFGNRTDFQVTALNGVTRVYGLSTAASRYNGYEASLINIERIQFADTTLNSQSSTNTSYSLTTSVVSVNEGNQVTFTITRSGNLPGETIYFSTWPGTASFADGDYETTTGTAPKDIPIVFNSGDSTHTITLNILQDGKVDSGQSFRALLQKTPVEDLNTNLAVSSYITILEDTASSKDDYADDPADTSAAIGMLTVGNAQNGFIGPADSDDTFGDKDVFKVSLTQGQSYQIQMQSQAINGQTLPQSIFTIRDPNNFDSVLSTSAIGANVSVNFTANSTGDYYIRVGTGGAATDQGGYQLSVNLLNQQIDTTSPTMTTLSPDNGATGVGIDNNILVTFSEAVQFGGGAIKLKNGAGALIETYDAASANLTLSGNILIIDPSDDFNYNTLYQVEFGLDAIEDLVGNGFAGISNYDFKTVKEPIDINNSLLFTMAQFSRAAYNLRDDEPLTDVSLDPHAYRNDPRDSATNEYLKLKDSWTYLSEANLPGLIFADGETELDWSTGLMNGIYTNQNAAALVARNGDKLVITFRGTNDAAQLDGNGDLSEWGPLGGIFDATPDRNDWDNKSDHYDLLKPLVNTLNEYINNENISEVYVTGHSLGAGMVDRFMVDHNDTPQTQFKAVNFASPGYWSIPVINDNRIANFWIDGDAIKNASWAANNLGDLNNLHIEFNQPMNGGDIHSMDLYLSVFRFLNQNGIDSNELTSFNNGLDFDDIFLNVTVGESISNSEQFYLPGYNSNSITSEVSWQIDPDSVLIGGDSDDMLIGGSGSDLLVGGEGKDILKGGSDRFGIDVALYSGQKSDYSWSLIGNGFIGYAYVVTNLNGNNGTDTLYDIESLQFDDSNVPLSYPFSFYLSDGYIAGASVFIDTNENGRPDPEEDTGIDTDSTGYFSLMTALSGSILAVGGTNIDTGLANNLMLTAPKGSAVVTPITTLINSYAVQHNVSSEVAETAVQTALGITADIDLTRYDSLAQSQGDATALEVQRLAVQVAELGNLAQANGTAFDAVAKAIATEIQTGERLNLAESSSLQSTLGEILTDTVLAEAVSVNTGIINTTDLEQISIYQAALGGEGEIWHGDEDINTHKGTAYADALYGKGNDDELNADIGNDLVDGGSGNDMIIGGSGNDILLGAEGDDLIVGVNHFDGLYPGLNETDTLTGGSGRDRFVLGDWNWQAYDDQNIATNGSNNYALITDLNLGEDVIQLQGVSNQYLLQVSGADTQLFIDKPGEETDELIGIFRGITGMILDSDVFEFRNEVTQLMPSYNLIFGNHSLSTSGNDTFSSISGINTVSYENAKKNVSVSLAVTTPQNTRDGLDTLSNIDNLIGSRFNDRLTGNSGNNILDGGAGGDSLLGGAGDDSFVIDNKRDRIREEVNAGSDTAYSSVSNNLAANVENLVLTGTNHLNGIGNGLDNILIGNDGNNLLNGGTGIDKLVGGVGDDTYSIDHAGDIVSEQANEGTDVVQAVISYTLNNHVEHLILTGSAAINGTGNELANHLTGNRGANVLDGQASEDTLNGGSGNDSLYGGEGNDTLLGGKGNDRLNGGLGADSMNGDRGNDTYFVDDLGDTIIDSAGIDQVMSSISYMLGGDLENLTLTGLDAINGTGNSLKNTLIGNDADNTLIGGGGNDQLLGGVGNDILIGGAGKDSLTGGEGVDIFWFDTAPSAKSNQDTLLDFVSGTDKLQFSAALFASLGEVGQFGEDDARFHASSNGTAHDEDDRFIYNTSTGVLSYDSNGNSPGGVVTLEILGTVDHPTITATDIWLV